MTRRGKRLRIACGATSLFIPNMSAKNGTVLCFLIVKLASSSNASVEYLIGRTGEKRAYRRVYPDAGVFFAAAPAARKKGPHLGGTHKTVLEMFSGNGVASAMPFLRFAGHSSKTREVFPQGHRKYQFAVPDTPLTYPAREHTPPLPCR